MNIFIFEFMTGGGMLLSPFLQTEAGSLATEGHAMVNALAEDFSSLAATVEESINVTILRDRSACEAIQGGSVIDFRSNVTVIDVDCKNVDAENVLQIFSEQAANADWTIVIAPEFDFHFLELLERVERIGSKSSSVLLSPDSEFARIAADKLATCERLKQFDCPTIPTSSLDAESVDAFFEMTNCFFPETPHTSSRLGASPGFEPARAVVSAKTAGLGTRSSLVVKPRFGCGSTGIRIFDMYVPADRKRIEKLAIKATQSDSPCDDLIVQPLVEGIPVSVSAICGSGRIHLLPACMQTLEPADSDDAPFAYRGGRYPVQADFAERAARLARQALECLPPTTGLCGVDMILSESNKHPDLVVEINPRMTTSYLGLREASNTNLAVAMLAAASGEDVSMDFSEQPLTFSCSGLTRSPVSASGVR